jgi:hypothetical protein
MHNTFLVHVLQRTCDLMDVVPAFLLWEAHIILYGFFYHKLQVSFLCPFYCNEELIQLVIYEPIEILYDIGMI